MGNERAEGRVGGGVCWSCNLKGITCADMALWGTHPLKDTQREHVRFLPPTTLPLPSSPPLKYEWQIKYRWPPTALNIALSPIPPSPVSECIYTDLRQQLCVPPLATTAPIKSIKSQLPTFTSSPPLRRYDYIRDKFPGNTHRSETLIHWTVDRWWHSGDNAGEIKLAVLQ